MIAGHARSVIRWKPCMPLRPQLLLSQLASVSGVAVMICQRKRSQQARLLPQSERRPRRS